MTTLEDRPRICLVMIVRGESAIIRRCLDSCKPVVDAVAICDTGSEDNTIELIEQWLKENQITGKVFQEPWNNFAYNRTKSFQLAQQYVQELGWNLEKTYALHNDADMSLVVEDKFEKAKLSGHGYMLTQRNTYSYINVRLTQMSLPWTSRTFTHEFWGFEKDQGPKNLEMPYLETLWLDDKSDGGYKASKFTRDVKLCKRGLIEDPDLRERYLFYLAQSYMCLGKHRKAIKFYELRTKAGGFYGEIWFAHYMMGDCYAKLGEWPEALKWYLLAHQKGAHRAEPLYKIAKHYRELPDQQEIGYIFADYASKIPLPGHSELFVESAIYEHEIEYEKAILGFYTRSHKEAGYVAAERLSLRLDIPDSARHRARNLIYFYAQKLASSYSLPVPFTPLPIEDPSEHGINGVWNCLNPSIVTEEDGYSMILRTVNYLIDSNGRYQYKTKESAILTRNFFVKLDRAFAMVSSYEILGFTGGKKFDYHIRGMEDCRLFKHDGRYYFTCTSLEHHSSHAPQICLALLAQKPKGATIAVESFTLLKGHQEEGKCEKNWLPFSHANEMRVIYNYDPLNISTISQKIDTAEVEKGGSRRRCLETFKEYDLDVDISDYRGSASPIPFEGGWLLVIHEVVMDGGRRKYLHRFVQLASDFSFRKITRSFYFQNKGIEYCSGMCYSTDKKSVVLTCGLNDAQAHIFVYPLEKIKQDLIVINVV